MKNIEEITPFKVTTNELSLGVITALEMKNGISVKNSIYCKKQTLIASYVYDIDGGYNLVYTIIDNKGKAENFKEEDGVLPTLFFSPSLENYVSVVPYHPNKQLEISIPIFNREETKLPKGNRPFTGKFIGVSNQFSIFYDVDIWNDKKPDKLLAIEFKNNILKKKHNIKVPLPRNNKIFIQNNEIHLLSNTRTTWLHRQIDEKGKEIRRRELQASTNFYREIISLSFESNSYVLTQENGKLSIETITVDAICTSKILADIKDDLFNTWQPEKISNNTCVIRFNTEFGNGWFTIRGNEILELFYSKDVKGFKDLISGEVIDFSYSNLIISNINKTKDNGYAVVLYPVVERKEKNKEMFVFQRVLE
ncbi:hypothetical protein KLA_03387 [Cellulophaga geojensis KL-A]|uniref:Uncharacterized protein n=1 Tax=Cellulophaga geojensis KL-A TaxID=1328323 RepID=A0ABP3BAJ3_9FLAO|nr:hypothetical protein [Cellulophaga geojensis]EWH14839.1 hypothetical protein KLA_03387 [Cellulophaga geojensis KL-A]